MEQICVLSFLSINTYWDIRKGEISLAVTVVYTVLYILYLFLNRQRLIILLAGVLPGLLLLCIGRFSGGALGMGDGLMVMVSGLYMGIWKALEFIAFAFILAAIWAGALMTGERGVKFSFPFVPFLLVAYAVPWIIQIVRS